MNKRQRHKYAKQIGMDTAFKEWIIKVAVEIDVPHEGFKMKLTKGFGKNRVRRRF